MVDFATLKKNSGASALSKLAEQVKKLNTNQNGGSDDRFWKPTIDKAGNAQAEIRFLPAGGEEEVPFISLFEHAFQGPTGLWYIEKSRTSLGQGVADPVGEYNTELWNMSDNDDSPSRKQARAQKRKLVYISNVYVIDDKGHPENNGKVFLYRYGKTIFKKISTSMVPQFEDEESFNPFDLWAGASFKLRIYTEDKYPKYDKSTWGKVGPLFKDDEKIEAVWKQCHALQPFLDPSNFKPYDVLKRRLHQVLAINEDSTTAAPARRPAPKAVPADAGEDVPWDTSTSTAEPAVDDDDDMNFFRDLAAKNA